MTDAGKQTALFFGFLTAAMTYASAQATPVQPQPTGVRAVQETVVKNIETDRKHAVRIGRELDVQKARR